MSTPIIEFNKDIDSCLLLCRGCLTGSGEMKNMSEWGLLEDFAAISSIQINNNDDITTLLCTNCEDNLLKCKSFQNQCKQSDELLKNMVSKKNAETHQEHTVDTIPEITVTSFFSNNKLILNIQASDMDSKIYLPCPFNKNNECGESFLKHSHLVMHLEKIHNIRKGQWNIELRYFCSFNECCYYISSDKNKWFTERKYLNQHYNKVHKCKAFSCDACLNKFSTMSEFSRHLKSCNQTFECKLCDIKYKNNERLLVHLMRKHPALHALYKSERKKKRVSEHSVDRKKKKTEETLEYLCESPKRTSATQTSLEVNIKNDVTLPSWHSRNDYEKTDEISTSTQTVFEDLLSLKSQTSEEDSIFFSENVSLSDIQTQTFPLEFGLSRSNKETITSETQSPDLSIKETQTCYCLYESPKLHFNLFENDSHSLSGNNLTSTETQTLDQGSKVTSDVMLSFNSTETQTCFEEELEREML